MKWRDDESLWFTGWSRLGSVYGVTRLDGSVEWMTREDAIIGTNSFSAGITTAPDKKGFAAVRESDGAPPEIVFKSGAEASAWSAVSNLNGDVAKDFNAYPEVRAIAWKGADGVELEGLVLLPRDGAKGPRPTIVDIHGGPSWAVRYAYNPGYALPFATAGYAVFLPNYRGNVGWGKAFGMLNIGDPAGAEFQDILAGLDKCVAAGISDPDRLGISGASYGGYLTAWAVATTNRFKAAVMVSGIANQLSSHYSCNHDFHAFINGGPLSEERYPTRSGRPFGDHAARQADDADIDDPWRRGPMHSARPGAGIVCGAPRTRRRVGAGRLSARRPWRARARPSARRMAPHDRLVRPLSRVAPVTGSSLVVFVMRRFAVAIPLLLIISFGVFALVHIAPGDPVRSLLGARASDPATLAAIRERYHLDDPFLVQYGKWLSQVVQGDLGVSIQGNRAVTSTIADRLGVTIFLELDEHRSRSRPRRPARGGRRLPPWHAARPGGRHVRCFRHQLSGLRHRHFPSLCLRRSAALVPDLRPGKGIPRPCLAPDASGACACDLGHGDRRQDHARGDDRGAGPRLRHVCAGARTEFAAHCVRLRAQERPHSRGHGRRAHRRRASSPARSTSRSPFLCQVSAP